MRTFVDADRTQRVTLGRVVRSEWTKLRSLRSTWITLAVTVLVTVVLAGAFGHSDGAQIDSGKVAPSAAHAVAVAFLGLDLLALVVGVLGVLQMSGEYGSGLIRASLAAVPRRLPVLWAKVLVLVGLTAPLTVAVCLASFLISQAFVGDRGASLGDPGVPGAILGAAAYPVAVGLLGLGIGAMLRNTAAGITTLVAALLVIPALLPAALPERIQDTVLPYVPIAAGQAMYALERENGGPVTFLSPVAGAVVLAAWVVLVLAGGAAVLSRRDA
jgi:ABC-2 type transport system permease protein